MVRWRTVACAAVLAAAISCLSAAAARAAGPSTAVEKYRTAIESDRIAPALDALLSQTALLGAGDDLDGLATALATAKDQARARGVVRWMLDNPRPPAACAAAELLWRLAEKKALSDDLAAEAAGLLGHQDPFVRSLADWAIATRVEIDNKGQEIAWPRPDPPEWFRRWSERSPEAMVEADYARFAVLWGIHYDGRKMLDSVSAIQRRAGGAASEALRSPSAETRAMVARQLERIAAVRGQLARLVNESPADLGGQRRLWLEARRAARPIALANPAADFGRLVFVKRHAAHTHRNITGSQYPWVHKPGGGIFVQDGIEPGSPVREVLAGRLGPGHVHGIDLWWDGDRVVFGYARQPKWPPAWDTMAGDHAFELRRDQEPTHLFEVRLDGSGLRQLTDHRTWNDFEPTYCPDGGVAFASDRSGRSSECGKFTADHTVINLYAVDADGRGLRRLSDNKDIDRYPHTLDSGLVAYTRWEYQERHFLEVHSIWTVRPDGTQSDALFKQHLGAPFGLRDTRSVPGSGKLVSIATGHHTFAYGPLVVIDPRAGMSSAEAIRVVTPHLKPEEGPLAGKAVEQGGLPDRGGLCQTPWALSDACFLVSFSYARPPSGTQGGTNASGFGVYLVDVHGNKELLHRDPVLSCAFPMPLAPRPRPPVVPALAKHESRPAQSGPESRSPAESMKEKDGLPAGQAVCYVADVHRGLEGMARGTVKRLRISQRVGWPLDEKIGAMRYIPGNAWEKRFGYWEWAPVRVLGEVPVEQDGSACFQVPGDTAVYFQALDENFMEVRRMRSHVTFQPGEVRGCTGCHETRPDAPAAAPRLPLALQRPPRTPEPPPWGAERLLGYEWLVQPVFDRSCVRCHGPQKAEGGIDLSATPGADGFARSFHTLFAARGGGTKAQAALVSVSDRFDGAGVTRPKQFGSHRSRLVTVLLDDDLHRREAKLARQDWQALVTWVDANAPYHDTFFNRRPADGGPPRRDVRIALPSPFGDVPAALRWNPEVGK